MNADFYLRESARTAADKYHDHLVSPPEMDFMLQAVVQASQWADQIKRALFYGKALENHRLFSTTSLQHRPEIANIVHAMLGCVTEAGELAEHVRDILGGKKPLDRTNLVEELGDLLWYVALGLRELPSSFEEAFNVNLVKLHTRFPEKFTAEAALNRDLKAERAVLDTHSAPNIASLEALLNSTDDRPVKIMPDGSVRLEPEHVGLVETFPEIAPGSVWQHRNGASYEVVCITNLPNEERYPMTVVYKSVSKNENIWSRRADDWHRSMMLVQAAPPVADTSADDTKASSDHSEEFHYAVGVLDRILIESTTLPEARRWAFNALLDLNQVGMAQPAESLPAEWDPQF